MQGVQHAEAKTLQRSSTCKACGETFRVIPNHPAIENERYCRVCVPVVSQAHRLAYVAPAEVGRADRLEDV